MPRELGDSAKPRIAEGRSRRVVALISDELSSFEYGIAAAIFAIPPDRQEPWYEFRVAAEDPGNILAVGGIRVHAHGGLEELQQADIVIVPGWADPTVPPSRRLADAVAAAHARGALALSICSGAFVLAESGILDGRQATTHWSRTALFAERYPQVTVLPDALYVDEGSVMTSSGGAAGLDLLLHYVRGRHGTRIANLIARQLIVPPHRQGRQVQCVVQPVATRPTDRLAAVVDWMAEHYREPLSVRELAARALMSERTFTRRFRQATGRTAIDWLINHRVERAKVMLEESRLSIDSVALETGFADADALRHHFRRSTGVSPRHYRGHRGDEPAGNAV